MPFAERSGEWCVEVSLSGGSNPVIRIDHADETFRLDIQPARATPVDYFLVAAACCLAKSLHVVMSARRIPLVPVRVRARAAKADGTPGRLGNMTMMVRIETSTEGPGSERLLADAKRICTITNTLDFPTRLNIALEPT